jgi:peptidyl-tRNA hydrolase
MLQTIIFEKLLQSHLLKKQADNESTNADNHQQGHEEIPPEGITGIMVKPGDKKSCNHGYGGEIPDNGHI